MCTLGPRLAANSDGRRGGQEVVQSEKLCLRQTRGEPLIFGHALCFVEGMLMPHARFQQFTGESSAAVVLL
eukprot:1865987-Amphidinium_carterae.1